MHLLAPYLDCSIIMVVGEGTARQYLLRAPGGCCDGDLFVTVDGAVTMWV